MKRARRRSESVPQSDVSFSDTEEYKPRAEQGLQSAEKGTSDRNKTELKRLKNREAARRVRERRSNQLNAYKSQVDDLRKENQKLLQIIAQLQTASLGSISTGGAPPPAAAAAGLGGVTSGSTLVPLLSGGAGGEGEGPPCGTASCLSAGAPHDSIDSGPSGLRSGDQSAPNVTSHLRTADLSSPAAATAAAAAADAGQQQQQQRRLLPTHSCPQWGPIGSQSGGRAGGTNAPPDITSVPDANASGEYVLSQPVNTSAVFSSSTMQLLSGCHSAPHPHAALRQQQQVQLLQRTCGCTGVEECDECEGVRVTLSSASKLPLVTTPGPRPKALTLEDLHLTGLASRAASQGHTGSVVSAPLLPFNRGNHSSGSGLAGNRGKPATAAAARTHSVDGGELLGGHRQQQQRLRQIAEQQQGTSAGGMLVDYVGTLEPSSRAGGGAGGVGGVRPEGHSSSGHAVFGVGGESRGVAGGSSFTESCYLRKSSSSRSTKQRPNPPAEPATAPQPAAAAAGSGGGSGSLYNTLGGGLATSQQQQQQWVGMSGGCSGSQAALVQPETAAAGSADMCVDPTTQNGGLAGAEAAAVPPAAAVGSDSSMVGPAVVRTHPGSFVAPPAPAGFDSSSDSFLAAAAAAAGLGICPSAAAAAAAAAAAISQQQQQGMAGAGSKATTGKLKGKKLMRSIAAAVSGLVKSGRRSSGSSTGGGNTPRGALAALQQQLVGRSMSDANMAAAPPLASQQYGGLAPAAARAGVAGSFTAGIGGSAGRMFNSSTAAAAAAAQQHQQWAMLGGGGYAASMAQQLAAAQQELMLNQLLMSSQFGSGSSGGAFGSSSSDMQMMMLQQQQASEDGSIILAAQQVLQRQQQQQRGSINAPAAAAAAAGGGEGLGFRLKQEPVSPLPASRTTARQQQQTSSPQLPPPQHQQQQQQASLQGLLFGVEQQQPLGAAGVLPLDLQATYTNSGLLAAAFGGDGGEGDDGDALADDVVMQLARQEGVLIDDPYCSLL